MIYQINYLLYVVTMLNSVVVTALFACMGSIMLSVCNLLFHFAVPNERFV